jgi:hypothetical protein
MSGRRWPASWRFKADGIDGAGVAAVLSDADRSDQLLTRSAETALELLARPGMTRRNKPAFKASNRRLPTLSVRLEAMASLISQRLSRAIARASKRQ